MPSPRCPRREMVSVSITASATAGSHEKLGVAVAAANRRFHEANLLPAEAGDKRQEIGAHLAVHRGLAHDALLHPGAAGLELRLDQRYKRGLGCGERERRRQHLL